MLIYLSVCRPRTYDFTNMHQSPIYCLNELSIDITTTSILNRSCSQANIKAVIHLPLTKCHSVPALLGDGGTKGSSRSPDVEIALNWSFNESHINVSSIKSHCWHIAQHNVGIVMPNFIIITGWLRDVLRAIKTLGENFSTRRSTLERAGLQHCFASLHLSLTQNCCITVTYGLLLAWFPWRFLASQTRTSKYTKKTGK